MSLTDPLTREAAEEVYTVLVEHAGASDDGWARADFVHHQGASFCSEYRFGGCLGFGGKFWRTTVRLPDGTFGEGWYVTAYPEDTTVEVQTRIDATNAALHQARQRHAAAPDYAAGGPSRGIGTT
ncbi:hypothetical protein [Nocardioides pakistanensis]